jgi:hypothetical protein
VAIKDNLKDLLSSDPDGALPVLTDHLNMNDAQHTLDLKGHVLEFLADYANEEVHEAISTRPQLLASFAEGLVKVRVAQSYVTSPLPIFCL